MAGESQDITTLADELQEQQNVLIHGVEQLEMCELARAALVSHLKEALREQVNVSNIQSPGTRSIWLRVGAFCDQKLTKF